MADDLSDRLAPGPPLDQGIEAGSEALRLRFASVGQHARPVPAEHMAGEHLSVEGGVGARQACGLEPGACGRDPLGNRGHQDAVSAVVASLSFSEVKKVTAASISSSRLPSSASVSWCIVWPMRWSVMRFSRKL